MQNVQISKQENKEQGSPFQQNPNLQVRNIVQNPNIVRFQQPQQMQVNIEHQPQPQLLPQQQQQQQQQSPKMQNLAGMKI